MRTKLFSLALVVLTIGLLGSCKKDDMTVSVTEVTIDPTTLEITVGDDVKLTATIAPKNATNKTVSWSSDKAEVATVDNQGSVHAVAPGTANITVTTTDGGKKATCAVIVKAAVVSVTGIMLEPTTLEITDGDPDVKLTATVAPENATDKTVSWASDKAEVATVDNEGNVHALAPGTANITVTTTDGSKTATCAVIVKATFPVVPLPGEFTINEEGRKVRFSKGNLYYVGNDVFKFETNQYDVPSSGMSSHVSHFYWSKYISVAVADEYRPFSTSEKDVFFTNATETTAKSDFTVNGVTGTYRTLSYREWMYLLDKSSPGTIRKDKYKCDVTICGRKNCLVLAPDDFKGAIEASYNPETWKTAEAAGLVCLPAAGNRDGHNPEFFYGAGYYWSSTSSLDKRNAGVMYFEFGDVKFVGYKESRASRSWGYSVRLVTECQ